MYLTHNIISLFCLVQLLVAFKLKCPDSAHRRIRANAYCNGKSASKYYCLFDENYNKFIESCHEDPDHVRPGEKYVITGLRRNINCSKGRLQPFVFWSNASSECVFIRSQCNEVGQILYNRGTNKIDISCRCDFRIGYDFIKRPKHKCFCKPLQEDCSCYLTNCSNSNHLTPDYKCVHKEHNTIDEICPPFLHDAEAEDKKEYITILKEETNKDLGNWTLVRYGVTTFIVCFVLFTGLSYKILGCTKDTPLNPANHENTETISKKNDIVQHNHVATHTMSNGSSTQGGTSLENTMLKNKIEIEKKVIEAEYEKMARLFVEIKGYKQITKILSEKHCIVIKGNPGDGKTTLAMRAMHALMLKGKRPLQLHSYKEFDECVSPNQNLVIFIDNLFGEFSVSKDDVAQWSSRSKSLEAAVCEGHRRNYMIIAIRNDIYHECRQLLKYNEFLESNLVDISYRSKFGLSPEDMMHMYTNYTNLSIPEETVFENLPKLGFPQCCRLYRETEELRNKGLEFFNNPLEFLLKEISLRLYAEDMKMAVLVCILLYGGSVTKSILLDNTIGKELKTTSMEICSVQSNFVKFSSATSNLSFTKTVEENGEEVIKFSHSSVTNALFHAIGGYSPDNLINYCDFRLLSMITTSTCRRQETDSFEIPDTCISHVCKRICKLLSRDVCSSSVLQLISDLYIWNDEKVFKKCLEFENLFIKAIDEKGWSILAYFSAVGCMKWVEHLYNHFSKEQALLALNVASGANELGVVKFIISKGCLPTIECCFNAVKGGHLDIILELVRGGVNLTEKCNTLTQWITTTSVLNEAAMQNQCHLIEPLLNECPDLIKVKSSIGATAIHFVAQAGDIALLEKLIEMPEFTPYDMADSGPTILHFACQNNKFKAVKYIINKYPSLFSEEYYCYQQGTLLHTAAQSGNSDLFKYVLHHNGKFLKDNGVDTIQLFRDCHVIINDKSETSVHSSQVLHVRDGEGLTILHKAVWGQSKQMVEFIVDQGLDIVNCISKKGENVVDFAYAKKHIDVDMLMFLKEKYDIEKTKLL